MARPVNDTPTLEGYDAKRFRRDLREAVFNAGSAPAMKVQKEEDKKLEESYNLMVRISDGTFF